jgi:hypothetical protein
MTRDGARAVIALLFALAACRRDADEIDQVEREMLSVTAWTAPQQSSTSGDARLTRIGQRAEASFDVVTAMPWTQYCLWVRDGRPPAYREIRAEASHLVFVRSLPGDRLLVEIGITAPGPSLRLHVSFVSQAD